VVVAWIAYEGGERGSWQRKLWHRSGGKMHAEGFDKRLIELSRWGDAVLEGTGGGGEGEKRLHLQRRGCITSMRKLFWRERENNNNGRRKGRG